MLKNILLAKKRIEDAGGGKLLRVVSHFDTDGITSAAIFSRVLERWGRAFSLQIVKGLDEGFVEGLPEDELLIFLDLASGSLEQIGKKKNEVIIFDHHEIVQEIPENVLMINPFLDSERENLSSAAICYLFGKEVNSGNVDLATLAVIGMVGDLQEKNIGKRFSEIIKDSETTIKKGLLLYPSTRPLDKTLEYCSSPFIPGVTGDRQGVLELLRSTGIGFDNGRYKALYELDDDEMKKLITSVMISCARNGGAENMIGNLFLVRFFNKLEDARELSALINACSRMGHPNVALGFCLGNRKSRERAEEIYIGYKQSLVSALKYASNGGTTKGKNYMIIHGKDKIKDTIIGTVASIISHSPSYDAGQMVIALAYNKDKIKVSARAVGREGRNVREVLNKVVVPLGGEVGGHPEAAGCLISRECEEEFLEGIRKELEAAS